MPSEAESIYQFLYPGIDEFGWRSIICPNIIFFKHCWIVSARLVFGCYPTIVSVWIVLFGFRAEFYQIFVVVGPLCIQNNVWQHSLESSCSVSFSVTGLYTFVKIPSAKGIARSGRSYKTVILGERFLVRLSFMLID